jgi:hypothetical protein
VLDASGRIEASTSSRGIIGSYYALHAPPVPGSVSFSKPFLSELSGAVVVEAAYSNGHKTVVALLDLGEISSKLVLIYYAGSRPVAGRDWRLLYLLDAETADAPMTAFMRSIVILVVALLLVPGSGRINNANDTAIAYYGYSKAASSRSIVSPPGRFETSSFM